CAEISRELNQRIDGLKVLEDYNLEITTPGIDQPLKLERQFPKHIGRELKVELNDGRTVKGRLKAITSEGFQLEEEVKKVKGKLQQASLTEFSFKDIKKTFVLVSFK
ncbi:MAG: hypothetical protein RL161_1112, partial [Bacteroidota bacterium]